MKYELDDDLDLNGALEKYNFTDDSLYYDIDNNELVPDKPSGSHIQLKNIYKEHYYLDCVDSMYENFSLNNISYEYDSDVNDLLDKIIDSEEILNAIAEETGMDSDYLSENKSEIFEWVWKEYQNTSLNFEIITELSDLQNDIVSDMANEHLHDWGYNGFWDNKFPLKYLAEDNDIVDVANIIILDALHSNMSFKESVEYAETLLGDSSVKDFYGDKYSAASFNLDSDNLYNFINNVKPNLLVDYWTVLVEYGYDFFENANFKENHLDLLRDTRLAVPVLTQYENVDVIFEECWNDKEYVEVLLDLISVNDDSYLFVDIYSKLSDKLSFDNELTQKFFQIEPNILLCRNINKDFLDYHKIIEGFEFCADKDKSFNYRAIFERYNDFYSSEILNNRERMLELSKYDILVLNSVSDKLCDDLTFWNDVLKAYPEESVNFSYLCRNINGFKDCCKTLEKKYNIEIENRDDLQTYLNKHLLENSKELEVKPAQKTSRSIKI